jgi:hypothetical protein
MLKKLRKYQRVTMVGFGVLLLLTWLAGPAVERLGKAAGNRKYATIDRESILSLDHLTASREARAFDELGQRIGFFNVLEDREVMQWLLLCHEAKAGGFIAEADNGPEMLERLAPSLASDVIQSAMRRVQSGQGGQSDFQIFLKYQQAKPEDRAQVMSQMIEQLAGDIKRMTMEELRGASLSPEEVKTALARFFGVRRMQWMYEQAPRVSDRAAIAEARALSEGAFIDYVTIPASAVAASVPDPGDAALQAQFDAYKTVKPGAGEYGIGYLLGPRVKLEYLKLDRKAIEASTPLDPVEVRKRWSQSRDTYKGEFAAVRSRVEQDIKREAVEKVLAAASGALQREVQKQTRKLETQGHFKALTPDWETARPRLGAIAPVLVEQTRLETGFTMPTPEVVVRDGSWSDRRGLEELPGIGRSMLKQGGITVDFKDLVYSAKEFSGRGPVAVQAGIPVTEALQDYMGDRYYFNILAVRQESAPDSMGDIREQVLKDYRSIQGFERLKGRLDEFRTRVQQPDGLSSIAAEFATVPAADPAKPEETPKAEPLPVQKDVEVTGAGARDPVLTDEVRKAVVEAARRIDPLTPPAEIPPDKAALAIPVPARLSVVVGKIARPEPLTIEEYRQNDAGYAARRRMDDLGVAKGDPFSLEALLARHIVTVDDRRIATPADLKKDDQD